MSSKTESVLSKKNCISSFNLIGEVKINEDYTFKIDEQATKSDWVYNSMNLGVDCGEKFGTIYSSMMGGYGSERDNVVYVHGKKDDGTDDFANRYTIAWEDREDEDILEGIGDFCFLTVGLERDKKGKVFYKKFLSQYDAIAYIKEHLQEDTVVNIKGNLKYSIYNETTQVKKEITSVVLSKVEDKSKYAARFTQTMLLKRDSLGELDKERGILPIYANVIDYTKMWGDKEVKCFVPFEKLFEYEVDPNKKELIEKISSKVFKVKKGVTEITFEGEFIEGGATVAMTKDNLPDDIKELVEIGAYTLEEALDKCSESTNKEKRMVLRKPLIKMVGDEGDKTPVIQKFENKYTEKDLIVDFNEDDEEDKKRQISKAKSHKEKRVEPQEDEDDTSWLNELE